jgi:hypothetical protein
MQASTIRRPFRGTTARDAPSDSYRRGCISLICRKQGAPDTCVKRNVCTNFGVRIKRLFLRVYRLSQLEFRNYQSSVGGISYKCYTFVSGKENLGLKNRIVYEYGKVCLQPEGSGLDSRWNQWNSSLT